MPLPSYKDIVELVKTGATIEAQEQIMELRQAALEGQEENINLRNRISELEARIKELEHVDGEPCPKCRKRTWVVESSRPDPVMGVAGVLLRTYKCSACGFTEAVKVAPK